MKHLEGDEYRAHCVFHNDTGTPNLTVNVKKGVYQCFACKAEGNIVTFYKNHTKKTAREFAVEFGIKSVTKETIDDYVVRLGRKPEAIKYLKEKRGYTEETIKIYKLGWDGYRVTFPILDRYGVIVNVRRKDISGEEGQDKVVSYTEWETIDGEKVKKKGWGKLAIYGEKDLYDASTSIMCAGEPDRILLKQFGFNAWCVTGGEGSWNKEWNKYIKNKEIIIIFDCDGPGHDASKRIANFLFDNNKVKVIDLGIGTDGEDVTDWFIEKKKTKKELNSLIDNTKYYVKKKEDYKKTVLSQASKAIYFNMPIMFKTVIAGKNLSPYQVPKSVGIQCDKHGKFKTKCLVCGLKEKGFHLIEFNDGEKIIDLIDISKSQLIGIIRQEINIPKCNCYYIREEIKQNIEELKLIPEIEFSNDESEYVVRKAYLQGDDIKTNQTYTMFGTTLPDPKNQQAIHLIEKAVPSQDSIEEFAVTDTVKRQLNKFKVDPKMKSPIKDKLDAIYKDFEINVTHIYQRQDLMLALDLTFHSVLSFNFLGKRIERGWTQLFVIGDTRTGKTETVIAMNNHYRAGERISAENTSIAGLIAGLQQTQNRWTLMWGKLPLNDKRWICIDEGTGLDHEDYAKLSDIRSSGIAEIIKVQTWKTRARTRLVVMANPVKRRLCEYSYGVLGIKEIIGQNEDVARFDFAISCSDTDVPSKDINKRHKETIEQYYTSDACRELVMFAWSRKPEDIIITEEAENRILEVAQEFGNTFTTIIPLVQGAEIRIKLARLSVALACRLYSTDETGIKVIVKKEHIDYIRVYLLTIYDKTGLDYYSYSVQRKRESVVKDTDYIKSILNGNSNLIDILIDNSRYTYSDFESWFGVDRKESKVIVTKLLVECRAIKKYNTTFIKTSAFTDFLRKHRVEIEKLDADLEDLV